MQTSKETPDDGFQKLSLSLRLAHLCFTLLHSQNHHNLKARVYQKLLINIILKSGLEPWMENLLHCKYILPSS